MIKNSKKHKPLRTNFTAFTNALCHLNATPLRVAVLAPCAWGGNLACGIAWQNVVNSATHNTANSVWQVFVSEVGEAKMGCLGGTSLSLSLLVLFGMPLR